MPHIPVLRVVPLERICRHEKVDPLRVDRLVGRISSEGIQVNPMICTEAPGGELVLLDGATRTEALKRIGLEFAAVQMVEPSAVDLQTWHHVIRQVPSDEVVAAIESNSELSLTESDWPPKLHEVGGRSSSVRGVEISPNATLSTLVEIYTGRWTVSRVTDPARDYVAGRFSDWSVLVEFPTLGIEDVMNAAIDNDLLPAGITRFLVPERALRLNIDMSLLSSPGTQSDKQETLDRLLEERALAGRIRRYDETVFILDD